MEILDTFIHLYSFIYTDTLWNTLVYFGTFNIMDNKNHNHVDGSNEKIHFPMTVIVVDDSSVTEEEDEVNKNENKEKEAEAQDKQKP